MTHKFGLLCAVSVLSLGAAFGMLGEARAADLPSHKSPLAATPAVLPVWDGIYAGVDAGYVWDSSAAMQLSAYQTGWTNLGQPTFTSYTALPGATAYLNNSGGVWGGHLGYMKQFGLFVVGAEGQLETPLGGNSKTVTFPAGSLAILGAPATIAQIGTDWKLAFGGTGTVGVSIIPNWLFYLKGGYAGLQTGSSVLGGSAFQIANGFGTSAPLWSGWQAGGGVEVMLIPGWSVRAEYLHKDFGNHTVAAAGLQYGQTPATIAALQTQFLGQKHFAANEVKVGVSYHFNSLFGGTPPVFVPTGSVKADIKTLQGDLANFNSQGSAKLKADMDNLRTSLDDLVKGTGL